MLCLGQQRLIDFDTIGPNYTPVQNGYASFNWTNALILNASHFGMMSGYYTVVSSAPNVIAGYPATTLTMKIIKAVSETFTMNSFLAASAWNDNLNISMFGLRDGVTVYSTVFTLQVFTRTNVTLNWFDIDTMIINSGGGTRNPNVASNGNGQFIAIDNMLVTY